MFISFYQNFRLHQILPSVFCFTSAFRILFYAPCYALCHLFYPLRATLNADDLALNQDFVEAVTHG
jgi:hypothetical protein